MRNGMGNAIGGYFELELPAAKPFRHPEALSFQSARAAFLALIRAGKPKRVWMPRFICDAMLDPLEKEDSECVFYTINEQFDITGGIDLHAGDWLLYVNYFGICEANIDSILNRFNKNQIILDYSHAFYASPRECLATIYSPRKFFGIPDGGLLVTSLPIKIPSKIDTSSISRMTHLLKRLADSPEAGYADYQLAENSLCEFEPLQMSHLTQHLLSSIDYERARIKRNENFKFLHKSLKNSNKLKISSEKINGPLCYPFITDTKNIREKLISEHVFLPTYWPDVKKRVLYDDIEFYLVDKCISIPCDHRYEAKELEKIIQIIHGTEVF